MLGRFAFLAIVNHGIRMLKDKNSSAGISPCSP